MNCYLCTSNNFTKRPGKVRDNPKLSILECNNCGLVMLDSHNHIDAQHYEESGMHGEEPISVDDWIRETDWDDKRRYNMLKDLLPNKKLLDFGCGNCGFLVYAKKIAKDAKGVELEKRVQKYWDGKTMK